MSFKETTDQLWRGEIPLKRIWWYYAFLIPLLLSIIYSGISFAFILPRFGLVGVERFDFWFNVLLFIPYNFFIGIAAFRASLKYEGFILWRILALFAAIGIIMFAIMLTYFLFASPQLSDLDQGQLKMLESLF